MDAEHALREIDARIDELENQISELVRKKREFPMSFSEWEEEYGGMYPDVAICPSEWYGGGMGWGGLRSWVHPNEPRGYLNGHQPVVMRGSRAMMMGGASGCNRAYYAQTLIERYTRFAKPTLWFQKDILEWSDNICRVVANRFHLHWNTERSLAAFGKYCRAETGIDSKCPSFVFKGKLIFVEGKTDAEISDRVNMLKQFIRTDNKLSKLPGAKAVPELRAAA